MSGKRDPLDEMMSDEPEGASEAPCRSDNDEDTAAGEAQDVAPERPESAAVEDLEAEPTWDEEVPIIPPDDEVEALAAASEAPTEPRVPKQVADEAPEPPASLKDRLQHHGPTQFGVLLIFGALVFGVLQFGGGDDDRRRGFEDEQRVGRGFPKIPVDGLDKPISSEDVRRLLARVGEDEPQVGLRAAPTTAPVEGAAGRVATVRARPGELYDDSGRVGVIAGTEEDRARALRREAAAARREAAAARAAREAKPKVRPGLGPEFFEPGGTLKVKETAPTRSRPSLDLEVGTILEATLVVGVSSLAPNVVVAQVSKDVRGRGRTAVRKGARLRGRARAQQDRLFLTFHSLEQGGETFRFEAYAADRKMPGVVAVIRASSLEERGKSGAGRGAVGAAGGVIGELVGQSLPGRVARSIADGVASEAQQDLQPDRSRVLELPVGRRFEVIVAGGGR